MSFVYNSPGLGNVGSYLISGNPYLFTSTLDGTLANNGEIKVTFPYVTRAVTIVNRGSEPLYITFASRADPSVLSTGRYAVLDSQGDAWNFNAKCKEIYLSMKNAVAGGSFTLSAEMTNISDTMMGTLSGSGVNT